MNGSGRDSLGIAFAALALFAFEPVAAGESRTGYSRAPIDNVVEFAESKFAGGPPGKPAGVSEGASSDPVQGAKVGSKFSGGPPKPKREAPQTVKRGDRSKAPSNGSGSCTNGRRSCQVGKVMQCACREEPREIDGRKTMTRVCEWEEAGKPCGSQAFGPVGSKVIPGEIEKGMDQRGAGAAAGDNLRNNQEIRETVDSGLKKAFEKGGDAVKALDKLAPEGKPREMDVSVPDLGKSDDLGAVN